MFDGRKHKPPKLAVVARSARHKRNPAPELLPRQSAFPGLLEFVERRINHRLP